MLSRFLHDFTCHCYVVVVVVVVVAAVVVEIMRMAFSGWPVRSPCPCPPALASPHPQIPK